MMIVRHIDIEITRQDESHRITLGKAVVRIAEFGKPFSIFVMVVMMKDGISIAYSSAGEAKGSTLTRANRK